VYVVLNFRERRAVFHQIEQGFVHVVLQAKRFAHHAGVEGVTFQERD